MIDPSILTAIDAERDAAGHGQKRTLVEGYAQTLGVSYTTLYRQMQKVRGRLKRVERAPCISEEFVEEVARIKQKGMMAGGDGREVPTEVVVETVARQLEVPVPSASAVNARLRKMGFREERTFRSVEAIAANQLCYLDFSRSEYFQLHKPTEDGDWTLVARAGELSYKADNQKLRTWVCAYRDAFSRVWIARAVPAAGESILMGLEFLDYVWSRPDDAIPLRSIPWMLQTDRGSLGKSGPYKNAMKALDIDPRESQAKEAQGRIENVFKVLWTGFELPLYLEIGEGNSITLSDYNERLYHYAVNQAQKQHPVQFKSTRQQVYEMSQRIYPPREIDVSLATLACRVETREVDAYGRIRWANEFFHVPQYVGGKDKIPTSGKTLRVYRNVAGEMVGELMDRFAKPFRLTPWEANEVGDFARTHAPTVRERLERELRAERKSAPPPRLNSGVKTLPSRPEKVEPTSVFTDADDQTMSSHQVRVFVNQRLDRHGYRIDDFANVYAEALRHGATRDEVDQITTAVLNHVRRAA